MEIKELTIEEMDLVFGGWKYDGEQEWLKGHQIACPYCHNGKKSVVIFQDLLGPSTAAFKCTLCDKTFSYQVCKKVAKK